EEQRNARQDQPQPDVLRPSIIIHVLHPASSSLMERCGAMPPQRRDAHLTSGGSSKVWCGAGDGTVHSRPSAASQLFAPAFSPRPLAALMTTHRKISWLRPKPKAPIDASMLKSANCSA